jgi:hypothetical protein
MAISQIPAIKVDPSEYEGVPLPEDLLEDIPLEFSAMDMATLEPT